jgi:hypothetical protein
MQDYFGRSIPSNFQIVFRRDVLAESLWQYGEEEVAQRALSFSDKQLYEVQLLAVWHHVNDRDPDRGPQLTNARVQARAAIEFVGGGHATPYANAVARGRKRSRLPGLIWRAWRLTGRRCRAHLPSRATTNPRRAQTVFRAAAA